MSDWPEWQPIETAPKDGSWYVICRVGEAGFEVGRYSPLMVDKYEEVEGGLYRRVPLKAYDFEGFNNHHRATHWLPLPSPPKEPNP